jgi:lipopolysaccharide export system protein LptA
MNKYVPYILLCFGIVLSSQANSQDTTASVKNTGKLIEFLSAESYNIKKQDSQDFLILVGHVKVKQANTILYGDSIILNATKNSLEGFGKVHINDADSVHTYADYLKYDGNTKKAKLRNHVKLTDGRGTLTTDSLDYDVSIKIGVYKKGGKLVRNKTVLKSTEGVYYGITRDVLFRNKVSLVDPENSIFTDTLEYNTYSQLANFISPTKIISGSRIIKTKNGNYNIGTRKGYLYERSSIDDSSYFFIANEMAIDDSLGLGEFRGNAVYKSKDSLSFDLFANNIKTNRNKDILLATELPILLIKQPKDTMYISADTLYSGRLSDLKRKMPKARAKEEVIKDSSLNKYFEAFHHVKIYSDSMQAVADSLFYGLADSTIRLHNNPILWVNQNQITGDTIYMHLNNRKAEQLRILSNAMAINPVDSTDYFNQLKGNNIVVDFIEGKIQQMQTKGSAENIYFATDNDEKFIGVNQSNAQIITIQFENDEPAKIIYINQLTGKMTPLFDVPKSELKFKNFKWWNDLQPKTKFDILSPKTNQ